MKPSRLKYRLLGALLSFQRPPLFAENCKCGSTGFNYPWPWQTLMNPWRGPPRGELMIPSRLHISITPINREDLSGTPSSQCLLDCSNNQDNSNLSAWNDTFNFCEARESLEHTKEGVFQPRGLNRLQEASVRICGEN